MDPTLLGGREFTATGRPVEVVLALDDPEALIVAARAAIAAPDRVVTLEVAVRVAA